ncbi:hypothetical protein ACJX0J_009561, partial [Zea mays]
ENDIKEALHGTESLDIIPTIILEMQALVPVERYTIHIISVIYAIFIKNKIVSCLAFCVSFHDWGGDIMLAIERGLFVLPKLLAWLCKMHMHPRKFGKLRITVGHRLDWSTMISIDEPVNHALIIGIRLACMLLVVYILAFQKKLMTTDTKHPCQINYFILNYNTWMIQILTQNIIIIAWKTRRDMLEREGTRKKNENMCCRFMHAVEFHSGDVVGMNILIIFQIYLDKNQNNLQIGTELQEGKKLSLEELLLTQEDFLI